MASPVFGVLSVRVGGIALEISGEWTYDIGGVSRESAMGAERPVGMKITPTVPYAEGEVFDLPDVPLATIKAIQDTTVTLQLRSGKTFVLSNASQVGELPVNAAEGKMTLRLEGTHGDEA